MKLSGRQSARTQVKICGLTRPEDVTAVRGLSPDYVGFVFAPSRRRVTPETATVLIAALGDGIRAVGVFVDETPAHVAEIVRACGLHVVQLHGAEDAAYLSTLRALLPEGIDIWKAVRIKGSMDVEAVRYMAQNMEVERFLLDAWHPDQAGGTGEAFDWRLLEALTVPYLLAGGLRPENVGEAIGLLHPWGVDVSSGVETDGWKDPDKMTAFLEAVRQADTLQAE